MRRRTGPEGLQVRSPDSGRRVVRHRPAVRAIRRRPLGAARGDLARWRAPKPSGAASALGAGGVWRGHRALFQRRSRTGFAIAAITAIGLCVAAFLARRNGFFPALVMIAAVAAGFCDGNVEDRADRAWGVGATDLFGVAVRFCRDT